MRTPLTTEAIHHLRHKHPRLRDDYFDYLSADGYGESDAGPTIYSGPIEPHEIYGQHDEHANILILGDDSQGYCFGYNTETECYGEISDTGQWESWPKTEGLTNYLHIPNQSAR